MNKSLFRRVLLSFITLLPFPAFSADYNVNSYLALFEHLQGCNTMSEVLTYKKDAVTITLAADPSGYCMLTVQNKSEGDQHQPNMVCHFTQEDVSKMTSPEAQQVLATLQGGSEANIKAEDMGRYFAPLVACIAEINKAHPLPPVNPTPPGASTGTTPIPPPGAVPPGAVPSGSLLTLPPGVNPAPGSPSSIRAP